MKAKFIRFILISFAGLLLITACVDQTRDRKVLFEPSARNEERISSLTGDAIQGSTSGIHIDFAPGSKTSVLIIRPENGIWHVKDYRFVKCRIRNTGNTTQVAELGFGDYDLTLGGTVIPPGKTKILKAVIYRTEHPSYIDSLFPVMHGKPDGSLRGWMNSTGDSVSFIRLIFNGLKPGASVKIGKIWLEEEYGLYSKEELKKKYYPFVDRFGQYMDKDWPEKIHKTGDLFTYDEQEARELAGLQPSPERDQYGGWATGPALEATGRFRVEKVNGKWWFVDPEGRLFWSHGIDCVEFGAQTRTKISGCENFFSELPDDGQREGKLYILTGYHEDTIKWLSFHALNLFRKYGDEWKKKSGERLHERLRNWGMNTIGNWSDPGIYLQRKTPYVLTASTKKTGIIADPYAPDFREDLERSLKARKDELGDPWCLGVFVDNELKWGVKWAPKIPEQILTAPPDQPSKSAFAEMLKNKYGPIENLNKAWGTNFPGFDDLLRNDVVLPGASGDLHEFMEAFTRLYYSSCRNAVKAVDPGMLYLGCRMDFHLYPEDTSLNYVIRIASEYCDVVSFNRYRYTCTELVPPDGGDYPLIIGEFHFGSLETGLLQPGLRYAADPRRTCRTV